MSAGRESTANPLAGRQLNRRHEFRKDDAWLLEHHDHTDTRFHLVWRNTFAVADGAAASLPLAVVEALIGDHPPVLLGELNGVTHWAIDVSHHDRTAIDDVLDGSTAGAMLAGLRDSIAILPADDSNLLAFASGITTWHAKNRFCAVCGGPTVARAGGHERHCASCGATHFPRTDPAVIMLIGDGDKCLLGRQAIWPPNMYSALAGFVEPGESLEDAVAREVREEVGLEVTDIRYHSSQPWPFPQSVMVGFHATYVSGEISPAPDEIEDARWFTRDELLESRAMGRRGFPFLAPPISIAGVLIAAWIDEHM